MYMRLALVAWAKIIYEINSYSMMHNVVSEFVTTNNIFHSFER